MGELLMLYWLYYLWFNRTYESDEVVACCIVLYYFVLYFI